MLPVFAWLCIPFVLQAMGKAVVIGLGTMFIVLEVCFQLRTMIKCQPECILPMSGSAQ